MTEIEKKALALVNEVARERGSTHDSELLDRAFVEGEALCRAIEQHEAFRQEVSDAVAPLLREWPEIRSHIVERLSAFIISKPDPLVEHFVKVEGYYLPVAKEVARRLRAARGLEIVEKRHD